MTYVYEWFSFPKDFSVTCPNCKGECNASEVKESRVYNGIKMEYNSGKIYKDFKAVLNCKKCGYRKEKVLNWKNDAYWKFEIKGKVLWAWSFEHSIAIMEYIESKERKQFGDKYSSSFLHIPAFFKLAKNRELIVKKIRKQTELHNKQVTTKPKLH